MVGKLEWDWEGYYLTGLGLVQCDRARLENGHLVCGHENIPKTDKNE